MDTSIFTPTTMTLQSLTFLTLWTTTLLLVRSYGPSKTIAPNFTKHNSRLYALLSLLLCLLILSPYQHHDLPARTLFHLSKFWEYVDILGVTAAGGRVDLHFGFHHLTTPWLTFVRVLPPPPLTAAVSPGGNGDGGGCEGWKWFAAANTAHHALMYAYFGGWRQEELRGVLLWTGQVQLAVGIVADGWVVWERLARGEGVDGVWRLVVSSGLLGTYWVLSRREMRAREREERKKVE